MNNQEVRQLAKTKGVPFWKIADELKISEPTMTRLMRHELTDEKRQQITGIIERLSPERS